MFEIIFKIWYMIAILPFLVFMEGSNMLTDFLKKRNIYSHWDVWHSAVVILSIAALILWMNGYGSK